MLSVEKVDGNEVVNMEFNGNLIDAVLDVMMIAKAMYHNIARNQGMDFAKAFKHAFQDSVKMEPLWLSPGAGIDRSGIYFVTSDKEDPSGT